MILNSEEETIQFGKEFVKKLAGGEVIALTGDLGSGKTTFTQGLAKGLGIKDNITSPTFVVLKEYIIPKNSIHPFVHSSIRPVFVHIDAYRVNSIDDIKSAGIEDFLNRKDVIMVIEWAEKIKEILPKNIININFKSVYPESNRGENIREIKIIK